MISVSSAVIFCLGNGQNRHHAAVSVVPLTVRSMSALQDDQPQFLLCVVDDSWSPEERRELAWGYEAGMDIPLLATLLDYSPREVVRELSRQVFSMPTPSENRKAPRFGANWEPGEVERLIEGFQQGVAPTEIARELGRDELGVCWRILETCRPSLGKNDS